MFADLSLNRLQDAEPTIQQARAKGPGECSGGWCAVCGRFPQNDVQEMARQVTLASGKPGVEDTLLGLDADTAAYYGRLAKANELVLRAANSAERSEGKEAAANYCATLALREAVAFVVNSPTTALLLRWCLNTLKQDGRIASSRWGTRRS